MSDQRTDLIKKLLIKFRKNFTITNEDSPDFEEFFKLLDLNGQLTNPKSLCLQCWSLLSDAQTRDHRSFFGHTVLNPDVYPSKDQFIQIAKENHKCIVDESGKVTSFSTPTSAPPNITAQVSDSQMSIISTHSNNNGGSIQKPPSIQNNNNSVIHIPQNGNGFGLNYNGPQMQPTGNNIGAGFQQEEYQKDDFGDEISVMNSYADNAAYVDSLNREERYAQKAKAMFDEDGTGNTGIEIIRLNKKFDIFMKRFMRAEEDIKEVKQNFYRVMHCAFAKYEQGFKRKNEYLERRRVKRREEIDKGVQQELKKRGMTGELDDPLLMSGVGPKNTEYGGAGHNGGHIGFNKDIDDSSIGLGGMGEDEESQSVRNFDPKKHTMTGIEDSELTNNIVGLGLDKKKDQGKAAANDKKKKDKKKDKKKKKKKDKSSDEEDQVQKEPQKGVRASSRLNKNPEESIEID